jgi:hypothetical protein
MKEAINLIVGRAILTSKVATAAQMADKAASEGDDTPKITEQINRAGEALSLFLSNLALTTDLDLPIGSGFDDELESSDGVPASSK